MAQHRKYAGLPDLDSAPDVYETAALDGSTVAASTTGRSRSPSPSSSISSTDGPHVSRRHLQHPSEARTRFSARGTRRRRNDGAARDEDGMGIDDQRRAYRASWRRLRRREGRAEGGEQDVGISEDGEEETLREKMTRLRRETREVMDEVERRTTAETAEDGKGKLEEEEEEDEVRELCRRMEQTRKRYEGLEGNAYKELEKQLVSSQGGHTSDTPRDPELPSIALATTSSTTTEPSPALLRASDLESRLSTLETVLGLAHPRTHATLLSPIPLASSEPVQQPILQSLAALEQQLALLSTDPSSSPALEALVQRSNPPHPPASTATPATDAEQASRIAQLYAALPIIEALTPHLSHTLTRLQSLRYIHTDAAGVSASLGRLEGKAEEVEKEIGVWREGVERVEALVAQGATELVAGSKAVEERVRGLEERIGALRP